MKLPWQLSDLREDFSTANKSIDSQTAGRAKTQLRGSELLLALLPFLFVCPFVKLPGDVLGVRIQADKTISMPDTSENISVFDGRPASHGDVREDSLLAGSEVRLKELSFWDLYKWHILGGIFLCVIETLLIVGLLVQRASRRQAENRFRQLFEAAPNGMLMVGSDGTIVLANAQTEKLFGYGCEELLGQPVELLWPERCRSQRSGPCDGFWAAPGVRSLVVGQDLFMRSRDGTEFPVEIGLSPVQTDTGRFVLASIVDLTGRRQAEEDLRQSQCEMRVLTGKLLQAQETERRRIARELHDDLNQSLALLSVEIELLGQKPPPSAAQLGERMQELSARVKQLSSAVHGLAHQLHPAKLEQLGLAAALRNLCKELAQNHGLSIAYSDHGVPAAVPEDTALCLYRIVQEALRNVIKHSGAEHAEVQLSASADAICLQIVDDGAGFDRQLIAAKGGLGLVSMRERLHLVRGVLAIDARPSGGTRIDVRVPRGSAGDPEGTWGTQLESSPRNGENTARQGAGHSAHPPTPL
jgi:PAS domain S-box-containing protein